MKNEKKKIYLLSGHVDFEGSTVLHASESRETLEEMMSLYYQYQADMPQQPDDANVFSDDDGDNLLDKYINDLEKWHKTIAGFKPKLADLTCYQEYNIDEMELV